MNRRYLYVSPEEYDLVKAAGASWDDARKSWYVEAERDQAALTRWLGGDGEADEFNIMSDEALVAAARVLCRKCALETEVICVYCVTGLMRTGRGLPGDDGV